MVTETIKGDIKSANGKDLEEKYWLTFEGPFEAYESIDEIKAKNDMPSDDEVLKFRNTQKRNAARQRLLNARVDEAAKAWDKANGPNPYEKPTLENSADLRYKVIYDALIAAKKSPEEAAAMAKAALGE